jgi:prephenate dehydrogenase
MTTAQPLDRLVVVGTGFMGASIAAAVKAAGLAKDVVGVDPKEAVNAKALGLVDRAANSITEALSSVPSSAQTAVLLASPVKTYAAIFAEIEPLADQSSIVWVTDIGSTKNGVIQAAKQLTTLAPKFVASHPMAGSEKQGARDANPNLVQGARVLISRMPTSTDDTVDQVESFWLELGAQPSLLPIEDHDALLAAISHLPHALAYSLAGALCQTPLAGAAQALHGGGLRDTTRIAASSPELWADIFLDNQEELLAAWSLWSLQLQEMQQALANGDRDLLIELLAKASHWRKGFQS